MADQGDPSTALQELLAAAERAHGVERATSLATNLERMAAALAAVRRYPLDPAVEPAVLPVIRGPAASPVDPSQELPSR